MSRKYLILAAVFGLTVSADQVTKYLAVAHLTDLFERGGHQSLVARVEAFYGVESLDGDGPHGTDYRRPPTVVVEGFWNHKYVENPGGAWGLLAGLDDRLRVPFFHVVSLAAFLFIGVFFRKLQADQRLLTFALSLVLGGAVGNYLDRLARGYVIDFVDWFWRGSPQWHWPTFNVADAAICVGLGMMLLDTLLTGRRREAGQPEPLAGGPEAQKADS